MFKRSSEKLNFIPKKKRNEKPQKNENFPALILLFPAETTF
jgi:hypothetical protein